VVAVVAPVVAVDTNECGFVVDIVEVVVVFAAVPMPCLTWLVRLPASSYFQVVQ